jgi:hypothetical protein
MAGESGRVMAQGQHRIAERHIREALGEKATACALLALPADDWTVLHNVAWPGRWRAGIDHVVIGPPGIFVVTTKTWVGRVTIEDGVLRHEGHNGLAVLRGAAAAAGAVASVWPDGPPAPVYAVLCLTGTDRPSAPFHCVEVCSTGTLAQTLTSTPAAISDEQARIVVSDLRWLLKSAIVPLHVPTLA